MEATAVSFGLALEAMKQGKQVRRKEWGTRTQRSISLFPGDQYSYPAFKEALEDDLYYWLPRHGDLVAEDWEVLT